ncbi:hypothetical protein B0H16DRAFT_1505237 [Mycena metata]|uniref:Protein kinase domain-containing protein n=1 Tax=Mycena metata TaxID=1033252 RepID=A0AAD7K3J1_9AGAR|nr:hypothetical protein B0H16DRAFT_1505237 [Mycena metata]
MEKASDDLDLPENIKKGLIRWVENGARMLIQVWSHMVRHNATFAQLTSYNLGVIVSRHRATGTLTISNFLEHTDTPILRATALTVYAYHDAVERYDEHIAQDLPLWIEDPYRAQTKATQAAEKAKHDEDEDQEDDEDSDENDDSNDDNGENDSNGDDDESDRDAGPSGGNGGARGGTGRGGGGDHSGSGPAPSRGGPGGNNRSGPATQGSAARAARATGRARSASRLDLDSVHLAFKVPKKHLWSTGFSHFSRMGPKTAVELNNPPNLDLITPVQEDVPVHFLENSALQYSVDQRRVSAGSARSSASSASASTRTSVPSLFSEPASSAPTSPSTTSSFTHASRDTSPFPEKANHPADDHSSTSATVCDAAGILIDDVLGESAIGTVWSGKMILEDGSEDDASIAIAVKMAIPRDNGGEEENESDAIRWESSVYDVLAQSGKQGISPQYYGAFEDRTGAVILVLDNAGTALKSFGTLKKRSRRALFAKAVEMHSVGIRHNDLVPRNIIQDPEGELTIIDFHIADLNHHCRGKDKCRELLEFHAALNL